MIHVMELNKWGHWVCRKVYHFQLDSQGRLPKKVAFEQTPESSEEVSHRGFWRRIPCKAKQMQRPWGWEFSWWSHSPWFFFESYGVWSTEGKSLQLFFNILTFGSSSSQRRWEEAKDGWQHPVPDNWLLPFLSFQVILWDRGDSQKSEEGNL